MIFFAGRVVLEFVEIRIAFAKRAAIEPAAVTDESMQVRVRPAHRDLDDVVQAVVRCPPRLRTLAALPCLLCLRRPVERQVRRHDHAPPDGGSRPFQRNLELVERREAGFDREVFFGFMRR